MYHRENKAIDEFVPVSNAYAYDYRLTDLDAMVYAHLYTIITTKLPITTFAQIVQSFANLAEFVRRIDTQYFQEADLGS